MKNAIKLFLTDIKKIAKTPGAMVLILGLAILPSFYAWFNLEATWDPYSNTDGIKIAVVNEDKGDTVRNKKINVGNQIEETLRKDDHFDWQMVSREKADRELKMGKYYAAIYIPEKFTHQVTGIVRKDPQQAEVEYKVNQKLNAIAPKMTDAGSSEIVRNANKKFNETVTKALLDEANRIGIKLEDQLPNYHKVRDGIYAANNALPKIEKFRKTLIYLDENQDQIDQYADKFRALDQYKDDAVTATERLNQLNASIPAINERAKLIVSLNQAMPDIERVLQVASGVPNHFPEINDGVDRAIAGTDQALVKLNEIQQLLPAVEQRVNVLQNGVDRASAANQAVGENATATAPQSTQGMAYRTAAMSTTTQGDGANVPAGHIISPEDAQTMTTAYGDTLQQVNQAVEKQLNATSADLETAENLSYGILSAKDPKQFESPLNHLIARMNNATKTIRDYRDYLANIEKSEGIDLSDAQSRLKTVQEDIEQRTKRLNALKDAISAGNSGQAETADVLDSLSKAKDQLNAVEKYLRGDFAQTLHDISNRLGAALNQGATTLDNVQQRLNQLNSAMQQGQQFLTEGQQRLHQLSDTLPRVEAAYIDAMKAAQAYFPQFRQKVAEASNFVENDLPRVEGRVSDATATVNEKLPEAFAQYDRLRNILDTNQPKAKETLHRLAEFARNDLPKVEKDLQKADGIFKQLDKENTIEDLIDLLRNDLKKQAGVIASPVDLQKEDVFPVKDYGSASTPFYTALAIWVGALLLVSLLSVHNKHPELKPYLTIRETYLGKMGLFLLMNITQATIVSIGDIVILKASIESEPLFIAISMYSALIFTTIVYTLVSVLGNPGKALAIVLLVLQIAGGGGTFPIEVTPQFFQSIHPFLPFSYSIDALREAVGGPVPQILTYKLTMLTLFGVGFFLVGLIGKPYLDPLAQGLAEKAEKSDVLE
ncbi:YhgE/Pip domain-containing protein [Staphylococcus delphini]|uniref:YhgE/Pip domain-containing protein n=1 Tax=Staphylococcus delphini TaxID=53344 RepID=UPI0023B2B020|nr:YhgE/Pip domain-containing protein [Staphylococcus delphini]MDE9800341.1 YhgE/Pip domain-containing protein [Staphylococcus delphini]MDE9806907.1 YhgE/Pip domain-containing protein [Staphylococcus delphini]